MEKKPNQHYVWRNYLKMWLTNGKIFCLQNRKYIFSTNPKNVASQRYFYRIDNLTLNDCRVIKTAFLDKSSDFARKMLNGWISLLETVVFIKSRLAAENGVSDDIKKQLEDFFKNQLEELYNGFENAATQKLKLLQSEDLSFLYDSNEGTADTDFIIFLCLQYFRTNKMKSLVIKHLDSSYSNVFNDVSQAFNIIALILATQTGYEISAGINNQEYFCSLLYNKTNTPFITGDQPIVNTFATGKHQLGVRDLELFYPIKPSLALLIAPRTPISSQCSECDVKKYNDIICGQSLEKLFSNEEKVLEGYMEK